MIQIKHRLGEIVLSCGGTLPADQLVFRADREPFLMSGAADYSAVEHLRDGRPIEIRALRPDDRAGMLAAVGRTSTQSLRRRFFAPKKKGFSEQELAFFLNIDFENRAEIAFVVVDTYQGQGIGTILMRHLAVLARDGGLKELIAEVLPENTAMLKVFKKFGFRPASKREPQVVHLALQFA